MVGDNPFRPELENRLGWCPATQAPPCRLTSFIKVPGVETGPENTGGKARSGGVIQKTALKLARQKATSPAAAVISSPGPSLNYLATDAV